MSSVQMPTAPCGCQLLCVSSGGGGAGRNHVDLVTYQVVREPQAVCPGQQGSDPAQPGYAKQGLNGLLCGS